MAKSYVIGVTGGSGSGKTSFLNALQKKIGDEHICIFSQDNYYVPINYQPKDENSVENFDTPTSFDLIAFREDVSRLKEGKEVQREEYRFNNPKNKPKILSFQPSQILIVEGIFAFYDTETVNMFDLKVFVDAPSHLMLKRRIIRDAKERGYDLDDVLYRYENHVMPAYERFILPHKEDADIVVNNRSSFENALEVLVHFIQYKLKTWPTNSLLSD